MSHWSDDENPDPSEFREEQEEAAYERWAQQHQMDPEETTTATAYEEWFHDQYADEEWYRDA